MVWSPSTNRLRPSAPARWYSTRIRITVRLPPFRVSRQDCSRSPRPWYAPTMAELDGQVAFVTGAGSGLGREIALTFARAGARVAVNDLRPEPAGAVHREIEALGRGVSCGPLVGDVSSSA